MFSIEKIHPAVRGISFLAVAIAIALGLLAAIGATVSTTQQAYADTGSLQAQSIKLTLPSGEKLTVPDGTKISGSNSTPTPAPAKLTAAQKQANKAWKKSGLQAYGKKYGWSCKKTWTKKSSTKAVRKAHFYYNVGSKQKFMDIIQTTTYNKKSGKCSTIYKSGQDGKTYTAEAFKWTLRHSAPSK